MTPEELANACAEAMWVKDYNAHTLGIELVEVGPGTATMALVVRETMLNGHNMTHGGIIFTLADTAFAYACNSFGDSAVAGQCQITYLRPGKLGDRMVARARIVSRAGRTGLTDVTVYIGDDAIAEFRGYSRTIGKLSIESTRRKHD